MSIGTLERIPERQGPAKRPFSNEEASLFAAAQAEGREFLENLPHSGFTSAEQHRGIIDMIDAIALPTANMHDIRYVPKQPDQEPDGILASWGTGKENFGQFSVHELFYEQPAEKRVGVIAHELGHGSSPLVPENAHLYGGEAKRAEAAQFLKDAAGQSLITNKYLDGYHKYLADQLKAGKIDMSRFTEETGGILVELGMTNRAKLVQVQTAQHNKALKMQENGSWPSDRGPVKLVSSEGPDGHTEPTGIDKQFLATMPRMKRVDDIVEHVANLKQQFYPQDGKTAAIARERAEKQAVNGSRWRMMKLHSGLFSLEVAADTI